MGSWAKALPFLSLKHTSQNTLTSIDVKFIFDCEWLSASFSGESRPSDHWLPIKFRINFKIAMLCFKCIQGHAPNYLNGMVAIKKTSTYNLHSNTSIQLEDHSRRSKKTLGDRASSNPSAKIWNSLPQSL